MRTVVVVPPASLPVTLAEAKRHAGIDPDLVVEGLDAYVDHLISAATAKLESMVDRALVTQTLETTWDDFPSCWDRFKLPRAAVQSVESVSYLDSAGASQVVDPAGYRVSTGTPGIVGLVSSSRWPSGSGPAVRYVAGYGDAAVVPDVAKLCINILVATWYGRREATSGQQVFDVPKSVDCLADALRWGGYP